MDAVPIARLKERLAHYPDQVKAGHSFAVTDHGIPAAILSHVAWIETVPVRKLKASLPTYLAQVQAGRRFLIPEAGETKGGRWAARRRSRR